MDPKTLQLLMGSAGAGAVADKLYIEDVFSTFLYTGTGATQTITNGIDLSGKGGLIWFKNRTNSSISSALIDTARGPNVGLASDTSGQNLFGFFPTFFTGFTSSGFGLGSAVGELNSNSDRYVSWSFRKAPKFFDVVTYTGTSANRTISHNLGSVPGCIIVKRTDTAGNWQVYHRSLANTEYMVLNSTAAKATGTTRWNSTTPTSTLFSLGTDATVNASGGTYVAYIFAHDAGGFGDSGNDSVISCGPFSATGDIETINLGWEPQWILVKDVSSGGFDWFVVDTLRGAANRGKSISAAATLSPNTTSAEFANNFICFPTSTGFQISVGSGNWIYVAIRRGPMKTPTDATKVFNATVSSAAQGTAVSTGFPLDTQFLRSTLIADSVYVVDRLRGVSTVDTSLSLPYTFTDFGGAEANFTITRDWSSTGFDIGSLAANTSTVYFNFRRAPGFFDVVAYTGDGTSNRAIAHNLSVTPELIIVKSRNNSGSWRVWSAAFANTSANLDLNGNGAPPFANGLFPATGRNSSNFIVNSLTNTASTTYISYLFASCPGISKTGSYTGTGTTLNVDCGFTNGARFVIIKRTDSTGDWYGWDTARGIVSGNDPYFLFNSVVTPVTNTDYIDPLSSGFQISSTAPVAINASGGTYIYLAIA